MYLLQSVFLEKEFVMNDAFSIKYAVNIIFARNFFAFSLPVASFETLTVF
jgi:hypothetical protein